MFGYLLVALLFLISYGFLTYQVVVDPLLSRKQRILRLAIVWLVPIFGLLLVAVIYNRNLGPELRFDPSQRNEHGPYR
jgi:hypothetical protein